MPSTATTEPGTTTEPEATTTTAEPTVEQQVEAAYLAIMAKYFDRLTQPDPNEPSIEVNHTGLSREQVREELKRYRESGQAARLVDGVAPVPSVESVEVEAGLATLSVCIIDNVQLVNLDSGETVDSDVVSKQFTATLVRQPGGAWALESQERSGRWDDGEGCQR